MKTSMKWAAVALAFCLPLSAQAHRQWMLPSATVLSGNDPWVTVDAAISNDLFYFDHFPLQLANLAVTGPDGQPAKAENQATGRYRSTFDVHLTQPGTYKMAVVNNGVFASHGRKTARTSAGAARPRRFAKEVPADAEDLQVTQSNSRLETFVTAGKPSDTVLKSTGQGLELAPITHPNDLFAEDSASFRFLIDGQPAAASRSRSCRAASATATSWARSRHAPMPMANSASSGREPGMYWISASMSGRQDHARRRPRSAAPAMRRPFEVLPQ